MPQRKSLLTGRTSLLNIIREASSKTKIAEEGSSSKLKMTSETELQTEAEVASLIDYENEFKLDESDRTLLTLTFTKSLPKLISSSKYKTYLVCSYLKIVSTRQI